VRRCCPWRAWRLCSRLTPLCTFNCGPVLRCDSGLWRVCTDAAGRSVVAGAMKHTVPCVGYVVEEPFREGKLLVSIFQS
jgi:hypothetical protein